MTGIFRRLFSGPAETKISRTAPLIALSGTGRPVWSERDATSLTRVGYYRNAVAYRCIKMIAEAAASVHCDIFVGMDEPDHHPFEALWRSPNARQTSAELMETVYGNLLCFGNAYLEVVADGLTPREIYSLRPDRVRVVPGPDGWPEAYEYAAGGQAIHLRNDGAALPPVLHLKMFDPLDDHYGFSPLSAAQTALDIHNAATSWNKALLDNSARPSGALVYASGGTNLTDEQFERLKEELETTFSGAFNAGRPILLEGGLDWKPLALSPRDMDFMETRSAAAREIALALGVPPLLLGLPGDNTYANYAEANRALWRQTVIPLVQRTTHAITHWLAPAYAPGLRLELNLDKIEALAPERDALWKRLNEATFLSEDERRQQAGFKPKETANGTASKAGKEVRGADRLRPFDRSSSTSSSWGAKYSDNQPRDEHGRWTSGGAIQDEDYFDTLPVELAAEITGFTKHGINQAITRSVPPAAILDALTNPIRILQKDNGSIRYVGKGAVVVVNPEGKVITVWGQ